MLGVKIKIIKKNFQQLIRTTTLPKFIRRSKSFVNKRAPFSLGFCSKLLSSKVRHTNIWLIGSWLFLALLLLIFTFIFLQLISLFMAILRISQNQTLLIYIQLNFQLNFVRLLSGEGNLLSPNLTSFSFQKNIVLTKASNIMKKNLFFMEMMMGQKLSESLKY